MPLYDYQCSSCGNVTEVRHGFNDTHDAPCAACGGSLTRVFNPAPILFKGSGFYITDSRKGGESKTESKSEPSSSSPGKESAA
ncbi:MAG: zinc ribbon domain-containing protein [Candidatus Eremiobacteraeota bacterium]|nr:zinc ribbon domain-containing protein [Candidatus Eremiobacteraeota bacterium]